MPRSLVRSSLRAALFLASLAPLAAAGEEAPAPAPAASGAKAPDAAPAASGAKAPDAAPAAPDIRWARSWAEATEEASERNVAIFLHSHGSTWGPCRVIHRSVFHDAEYVAWANRETVHVISYSLDPEAPEPEPVVPAERDGEKVEVLKMYPMFTPAEAEALVVDANAAVLFPTKTPWAGVLSPDGKRVLAEEPGKKTAKEFRALYEAQQKALGPSLDRTTWSKIRAAVDASSTAEFDEKWAEATKAALEARALAKDAPKPLAERVTTRVESLAKVAKERIAAAEAAKDAAALARLKAAFAGLP